MDIEIILEPDLHPNEIAEIAVKAEEYGVRALWSSNYHQNWDAFMSLVPAAQKTSKILLGPLAISPFEMHPLKMANSLLTLNEMSEGRAIIAVGAGGGTLGAMGEKPFRIIRAVREALEIIIMASQKKLNIKYEGEIFKVTRPFMQGFTWAKTDRPKVYTCSTEEQMLRLGGQYADGLQMSDVALPMLNEAMKNIQVGLSKREESVEDFRIGNFWAWHIKKDREESMKEARRELIFRGSLLPPFSLHHFLTDEEAQIVIDNYNAGPNNEFAKAYISRSGVIENVPEDLVNKLIDDLSSAGDMGDIDKELERFYQFKEGGITDLSIRLFDDPWNGLKMIGEQVLPALKQ
ncbi:MAG TPA: hypothetical protein DCL68_00720 [Gammaproteobacteria bacterium]|nr:hypothetical protein [Gammaproteobacteria bacterium]|tara:strand:- start:1696 stop:2739 length:1044 start_codon:yes stop_codon:yes gene_type:complete